MDPPDPAPPQPLSPDARAVLQRARALEESGEEPARALLRALLEDRWTRALLMSVFNGHKEELLDLRPAAETGELIRLAHEQAREMGATVTGPEHLLIAVVRTSPGHDERERRGLTPQHLIRAAARRRGILGSPGAPLGVALASISLLLQAVGCGCAGLFSLRAASGVALILDVISLCWSTLLCLVVGLSVGGADVRAWSVGCAYLLVSSAFMLGAAIVDLMRNEHGYAIGMLVALAITGGTFLLLFSHRRWFGVTEREKWRTLWRQGGWALVITGALDLGSMILTPWP